MMILIFAGLSRFECEREGGEDENIRFLRIGVTRSRARTATVLSRFPLNTTGPEPWAQSPQLGWFYVGPD
jgi:hypothetical protein